MATDAPDSPSEGSVLSISGEVAHIIELALPLEKLANEHNIFNVFDDGGYRTLVLLTMFGLRKAQTGRLGNDAVDAVGNSYELKTTNLVDTRGLVRRTYPGITTEHTLTQRNIDRYRQTKAWLIGVFHSNQPLEVWEVTTPKLEVYFEAWEYRLRQQRLRPRGLRGEAEGQGPSLNNPKIAFGYVAEVGVRHIVASGASVERPAPGRYKLPTFTGVSDGRGAVTYRARSRPSQHQIGEELGPGRQMKLLD